MELFDQKLFKEIPTTDSIKAFELFDKEKSGNILLEDFKHVMLNLCDDLNKEEIEDFLKLADQQGDGVLRYKDFVKMLKS